MARVWGNSQQSGGGLLVMLALADFANDAAECWPSIPILAQKARLTEREIRYLLPKLEEAGEVRLQRSNGGRNRRNRYVVTVSENPENISLKKIQGKNFTEICDTKTLKPTSGALNRHRTVNKKESTEPGKLIPDSLSTKEKKKHFRAVPAELQPAISRVVAKINELSGSQFRDDKPGVLKHLIARLSEGATESDCIAVIEYQWLKWGGTEMADNFNTVTLFREANFPRYLENAKRANGNSNGSGPPKIIRIDQESDSYILEGGIRMNRGAYRRKYGRVEESVHHATAS